MILWNLFRRTKEKEDACSKKGAARLAGRRANLAGKKSRRGITLTEMAVVLLIIGTLIGILIAVIDIDALKEKTWRVKIKTDSLRVQNMVAEYERAVGPMESDQSLAVLMEPNEEKGWTPPKKRESILDPWNQPYYVKKSEEDGSTHICTFGKDRREGGAKYAADFCITDEATFPPWAKKR